MNFSESQKAVLVSAVIHKRGLQRRFDSHDFRQINVSFDLFAAAGFEFDVFDFVSVNNDDAGFFGMGVVNQHSFGHKYKLRYSCSTGCLQKISPAGRLRELFKLNQIFIPEFVWG